MKEVLRPAVLALGLAACGFALAQAPGESGVYLGGALGQGKAKDACDGLPAGFSCDDKDTAWRLFTGYQVNRWFGVELGYADLGKAKIGSGATNLDFEAKALDLVAIGSVPLVDRLSAYGKLGGYRGDVTGRAGGSVTARASDNNTDLTYGFGARYDVTRNVGVRAEWQRYKDMGGDTVGKSDVDMLSLGVLYKFQ